MHSCFNILLPFNGAHQRRPHPWLGSVAVIIPHKQGLLRGKGSLFFFFFAFLFWGFGKGDKEQRGETCLSLEALPHLVVQCALDNVCVCVACVCVCTLIV